MLTDDHADNSSSFLDSLSFYGLFRVPRSKWPHAETTIAVTV